jgi:hypothetical protein
VARSSLGKNFGSGHVRRLMNRVFFFAVAVIAMTSMGGNATGKAPNRRDQAPGFYRVRVGDFEITTLYDGAGAFDAHWLQADDQATVQSISDESQRIPHFLDATAPRSNPAHPI